MAKGKVGLPELKSGVKEVYLAGARVMKETRYCKGCPKLKERGQKLVSLFFLPIHWRNLTESQLAKEPKELYLQR